jgi:hypothetical protein
VNPSAATKILSNVSGPAAEGTPKKESELREILAIFVFVFLMQYLPKCFSNWLGFPNPSALALAILSAGTVSMFVHRPRKLFGFFEPKKPILTEFFVVAAIACVVYLVGRIWHF